MNAAAGVRLLPCQTLHCTAHTQKRPLYPPSVPLVLMDTAGQSPFASRFLKASYTASSTARSGGGRGYGGGAPASPTVEHGMDGEGGGGRRREAVV